MRSFYGLLSNAYTTALVSPEGSVDWLPVPRFDSDAIFCRLLDEHSGGFMSLRPEAYSDVRQKYLDGTNILETTFVTEGGEAVIRDFLPIGRTSLWRRVKTDVPLVLACHPTFKFGAVRAAIQQRRDGAAFTNPNGDDGVRLIIDGPHRRGKSDYEWIVGPGESTIVFRYSLHAHREQRWLSEPIPADREHIEQRTSLYWKDSLFDYSGAFQEAFDRSVLVIRGLTYRTNGALIAAATTSLPEAVGGTRQWDYRFVWIRDGAYGAEALLLGNNPVETRRFIEFLFNTMDLVDRPFVAPFYGVDGIRITGEQDLLWLSGFLHSRPVRVGNAATDQLQLDIEGDLLWIVYRYYEDTRDDVFLKEYWWAIAHLVSWVEKNWDQPDASLWEFRGQEDRYTHSQLMCWVALRVGAKLARKVIGDKKAAASWDGAATVIRQRLLNKAEARGGFFVQGENAPVQDAALLTLPLYNFIDASHPLFQNTLERIKKELVTDEHLVFRYRHDNMGPARHPFTLAGFWYARVLMRLGHMAEADKVIDRHVKLRTNLGLYGEHVDAETNDVRGNFPQLFPHAALVTTLLERQAILSGKPVPGHASLRDEAD